MDNKLKIISHLGKNIHSKYTMNSLSKILGIPYASFYRTIQVMKDSLIIETIGKAKTIGLNLDCVTTQPYLTIASEEEKNLFIRKQHMIRVIQKELETTDIMLLFGSYAKGEERENSDVDIMIINKTGKNNISFGKYSTLYKKDINPICITEKEFKLMLQDKEENVGKQALKGHVILKNPKRFWELVLDAIQRERV